MAENYVEMNNYHSLRIFILFRSLYFAESRREWALQNGKEDTPDLQIDAPDAQKTAFCTPRQRRGIPCLCKNGSITSFSGFPISYERRRQRRKLSIYYMSAVEDFRRDTTVGLLFGGGENFIPRQEWLLGRKKRKRRATSHSEATLRFLFVIPHGSRPPKEHRNPGSYNQSGGGSWIRTSEVMDNRFTVCPLWPLGNSPISFADLMSIA